MSETIDIQEIIPASPAAVYAAWLDSTQHGEMTGGEAECSNEVGANFSAWDGYITGTNKSLVPEKEIIQNWRTSEFMDQDPDSLLQLIFTPHPEGCLLRLIHTEIPESQTSDYAAGWIEHYFTPMKAYFGG